jgi:hypothetical protein
MKKAYFLLAFLFPFVLISQQNTNTSSTKGSS